MYNIIAYTCQQWNPNPCIQTASAAKFILWCGPPHPVYLSALLSAALHGEVCWCNSYSDLGMAMVCN